MKNLTNEIVEIIQDFTGEDELLLGYVWPGSRTLKYQSGIRMTITVLNARCCVVIHPLAKIFYGFGWLRPTYTSQYNIIGCVYCFTPLTMYKMLIKRRVKPWSSRPSAVVRKDPNWLPWAMGAFVFYKGHRVCIHCFRRRMDCRKSRKQSDKKFRQYFGNQLGLEK